MGSPVGLTLTVIMIVVSLLLFSVASVLSQQQPPPFLKLGCPKPTLPFVGDGQYCFVGGTSCIRDREYIIGEKIGFQMMLRLPGTTMSTGSSGPGPGGSAARLVTPPPPASIGPTVMV